MKKVVAILLALMMVMSLSMTALAEEKTIVVNLTAMQDSQKKVLDNGIAMWEEANPGFKADLQWGMDTSDWGQYTSQLLTKFAAGEQMDTTYCAVEGVAFLADNGAVVPLDDYIAADPELSAWYADISPEILKCMMWEGKIYGMPYGWNPAIICYNKDMFAAAGIEVDNATWNVEQFLDAAKKLTTEDCWGFVIGYALSQYQCMLSGNNTYTMNEDWTESWWANEKTIETFQLIYDMIKVHKVTPMVEASIDARALFTSGQAAMYITGAWDVTTLNNSGINWGFLDIPMGSDMIKGTSYGADFYMLSSTCENPEETLELMLTLTGPEQQAFIAANSSSVPSTKTAAYSDVFLSQGDGMQLLYDGVLNYPNARVICSPTFLPETQEEFYIQWADCLAENISVAEFCQNMHDFTVDCIANQ